MSDLIVFSIGFFVSLLVAGAVGLLLWGAAHEPREGELRARPSDQLAPGSDSSAPAPASAHRLETQSLV